MLMETAPLQSCLPSRILGERTEMEELYPEGHSQGKSQPWGEGRSGREGLEEEEEPRGGGPGTIWSVWEA